MPTFILSPAGSLVLSSCAILLLGLGSRFGFTILYRSALREQGRLAGVAFGLADCRGRLDQARASGERDGLGWLADAVQRLQLSPETEQAAAFSGDLATLDRLDLLNRRTDEQSVNLGMVAEGVHELQRPRMALDQLRRRYAALTDAVLGILAHPAALGSVARLTKLDIRSVVDDLQRLGERHQLSSTFAGALERLFITDPVTAAFAVRRLSLDATVHQWAFAGHVDWRLAPLDDGLIELVIRGASEVGMELGASIVAQRLTSGRRGAKSFLPPAEFVNASNLLRWRRTLSDHGVPAEALLYGLVEQACSCLELLAAPRDLAQHEIALIQTLSHAQADYYPLVAAQLLAGLARKSDYVVAPSEALVLYQDALKLLPTDSETYRWLRYETIARARGATNQPYITHDRIDAYSAADMRLLVLGCAAVGENLCGVLLSEMLRREHPDRPTSVFAGWMSLYFGAPTWSVAGFQQLGYVGGNDAGAFPQLRSWPHASSPKEIVERFRRSRQTWPRISIVVPSFQQGKFIEQTLLSLINQGYPDLEIIVEDGGSTDETSEILHRYRDRIRFLRSGPDEGQSAALTHGFTLATGEILSWLNSDDMLAPLALFHIAETYISGADLVVGACFEFKDGRFLQINLPGLPEGPLERAKMADLKNEWFMGQYFYQPEVFFSAEIYQKAGGYIDASLKYTMDYDLWMRLAGAGASVAKVRWPIALFRRHEEQKTFSLDRTVIEQGDVRSRYVSDFTDPKARASTTTRLAAVWNKRSPRVLIVTGKYGRFFPIGFEHEMRRSFDGMGYVVDFAAASSTLAASDYDLVIAIITLTTEELAFLRRLRAEKTRALLVGWFWDNHHMFRENLEFASVIDIAIAAHDFAKAYLQMPNLWLMKSSLICYTQWSRDTFERFERTQRTFDRNDALLGGFVAYPDAPERTRCIERLQRSGFFPKLRLMKPEEKSEYFVMAEPDKFREWCGHKVSLCANVERDIPIRFFDALVTGQIPLIPASALDIDLLRSRYPEEIFVVLKSLEVDDVRQARREALDLYRQAGPDGLNERISRAMRSHSFYARLSEVLDTLRQAAIA